MTTNRLVRSDPNAHSDMPRGDDDESVAARRRYWINHGNASLAAKGMGHLQWCCVNGHYFIEPRA